MIKQRICIVGDGLSGLMTAAVLAKVPGITPEQLYQTLISFVGELATFTAPDKRSPQLPDYQHNNLSDIFNQCVMLLTQGLSTVLEQTAIELPLEKSKFGIFVSPLNDKTLLDRGEFILAIKANLTTDEIRKRLPAQIKIGAVEQIRELVNNQLPGISLTHLTVAPRQVPYQVGYCYFQLKLNQMMDGQLMIINLKELIYLIQMVPLMNKSYLF